MSIFKNINEEYGRESLKTARDLENVAKKQARFRNHLVFSLRCKQQGVIPVSLRIKCPVNTKGAQSIVKRAERGLLCERIRVINSKLRRLESDYNKLDHSLDNTISVAHKSEISRHIESTREAEFLVSRQRQVSKFERLQSEIKTSKAEQTIDLSGEQLKNGSSTYLNTS